MRRLILLLTVGLAAAIFVYRQRLFLRDPLGKVEVNGTRLSGGKVFINYSNDVLVFPGGGADAVIVQGWDRTPGSPEALRCVREMACLTASDHAPKVAGPSGYDASVAMNDREVSFRGVGRERVRVVIR